MLKIEWDLKKKSVCSNIGLEETLTEATDSPLYLTIKSMFCDEISWIFKLTSILSNNIQVAFPPTYLSI